MSSLLVCAQPATGQPASFVPLDGTALLRCLPVATHLSRITPASRLEVRPSPEVVSTGIPELDALTGGLPRGCLTEIYGPPSSGRTSVLLSIVAAATRRQEACALVDVSNAFDPHSATAAGVDLQQLLWVRCDANSRPPQNKHERRRSQADMTVAPDRCQASLGWTLRLRSEQALEGGCPYVKFREPHRNAGRRSDMARMEQALKVTDLLVQSGGFGLIAIDLGDLAHNTARRIPLASWFRFRRAVENTPTVLLVIGQGPCARTCASLVLRLEKSPIASRHASSQLSALSFQFPGPTHGVGSREIAVHNFPNHTEVLDYATPAHACLFEGISIHVELERSRLGRKPPQSDKTGFETRASWYV